jgi:hypothetical protein
MDSPVEPAVVSSSDESKQEDKHNDNDQQDAPAAGWSLWHSMATMPWPYMFVAPVVFTFLIGFGWTTEDRIEDDVANIWIPQSGDYAKDQDYAESLGVGDWANSNFAAMCIARDGENLFTENRLEEIRKRMVKTEATTVRFPFTLHSLAFKYNIYSTPYSLTSPFIISCWNTYVISLALCRLRTRVKHTIGMICVQRNPVHIRYPAVGFHRWIYSTKLGGSSTKRIVSVGTMIWSASYSSNPGWYDLVF